MHKGLTERIILVLLATSLCVHAADDTPLRQWTSAKGLTVEAQFVRQAGSAVVLKTVAGKQLSIRLSDLSTADQDYVRTAVAAGRASAQEKRAAFLRGKTGKRVTAEKEKASVPDYLRAPEWAVITEMSLARQDPAAYADVVRQYRRTHTGGNEFATTRGTLTTREGLAAVDEAIEFLDKQVPIGPLGPSEGLSDAARDHAEDIGPAGIIGHTGSDGSQPADRVKRHGQWKAAVGENIQFGRGNARHIVMQLIIDDGVPDRGHRTNIFNKKFAVAGVAIDSHQTYGSCCVIDFAGGFSR